MTPEQIETIRDSQRYNRAYWNDTATDGELEVNDIDQATEAFEELIAEHAALKVAQTWRPIAELSGPPRWLAFCDAERQQPYTYVGVKYYNATVHQEYLVILNFEPTHFCELPEPPKCKP